MAEKGKEAESKIVINTKNFFIYYYFVTVWWNSWRKSKTSVELRWKFSRISKSTDLISWVCLTNSKGLEMLAAV